LAHTATVQFGGLTIPGVKYEVQSAYIKTTLEDPDGILIYGTKVWAPDGTTEMTGVGWDTLKATPDLSGSADPMVQAVAAMVAKLTADGATDIVEVV
jgi:hypothetical protein